jgi:hypothetical protein
MRPNFFAKKLPLYKMQAISDYNGFVIISPHGFRFDFSRIEITRALAAEIESHALLRRV